MYNLNKLTSKFKNKKYEKHTTNINATITITITTNNNDTLLRHKFTSNIFIDVDYTLVLQNFTSQFPNSNYNKNTYFKQHCYYTHH